MKRKSLADTQSIPKWLTKNTLVRHKSDVVFLATQIQTDGRQHFVGGMFGHYPIEECKAASLKDFDRPQLFITEADYRVSVRRHPQGLLVGRRLLVKIAFDLDESLRAAQSLAAAFDGSIYSEEVTA